MKRIIGVLILLSGCAAPVDEMADVDHSKPLFEALPGDPDAAPLERTIDLVEASGGPLLTGVVPLAFEVEYENVYDVQWEILAAPNMFIVTGVRGNGCNGASWSGGLAAESWTHGRCDAFAAGDHEVEAFFDIPVASYSVRIWGTAVVNETAQPSSPSS